jgi:hypothetical protein
MINQELLDQIVDAYTNTRMTVSQFEALVRQALESAEIASVSSQAEYDRGFSDGYEEAESQHRGT